MKFPDPKVGDPVAVRASMSEPRRTEIIRVTATQVASEDLVTRSLRDNPLTPDLTAEQLQLRRRGEAAALAGWNAGIARAQAYPHGTEPWHPGEPDDHLVGFATKEDRDAYQRHAPGPFERVRRATPPTCEDLRRLVDGPDAAAVAYLRKQAAALPRDFVDEPDMFAVLHLRGLVPHLDPKPPPQEDEDDREWAMFRHARDEIHRYLDSKSRHGMGGAWGIR